MTVWDSDRFTADEYVPELYHFSFLWLTMIIHCSSLGTVDIDVNDLFETKGKMRTYERTLGGAIRESNNNGSLKYSAGYFEAQDLKSGSMKAPAGTTIKMKVGGTGAPLVDDANSQKRAGHCE